MDSKVKKVGQTKEAGFQFGIRRTINIDHQVAWDFMFSLQGLKIWLGKVSMDTIELQKEFILKNGISGKVTVFKYLSHLRMIWKKKEWENKSRVQLRIYRLKEKSVIAFHHELLSDENQREEMKRYWNQVIGKIEKVMTTL